MIASSSCSKLRSPIAHDFSEELLAGALSTLTHAAITPLPASSTQVASPVSAWNQRKKPASCCSRSDNCQGQQTAHARKLICVSPC